MFLPLPHTTTLPFSQWHHVTAHELLLLPPAPVFGPSVAYTTSVTSQQPYRAPPSSFPLPTPYAIGSDDSCKLGTGHKALCGVTGQRPDDWRSWRSHHGRSIGSCRPVAANPRHGFRKLRRKLAGENGRPARHRLRCELAVSAAAASQAFAYAWTVRSCEMREIFEWVFDRSIELAILGALREDILARFVA